MGLSRHERGLRDPNRTICPATMGQDTFYEAVLTACRHGMNEILHFSLAREGSTQSTAPGSTATPAHATPIPASVHAPLTAPQWGLRGCPTGPPCRRPLRVGSQLSSRPHDERPPLHGRPHASAYALTPACAATRARSPTSEPLPAASGPSRPPAARGGVARRQLPRGARRGGGGQRGH